MTSFRLNITGKDGVTYGNIFGVSYFCNSGRAKRRRPAVTQFTDSAKPK
jgi:hypothetical protein